MVQINVQPKEFQNGEIITSYTNTVGTTQETFTFTNAQETVILKNKGSKNINYVIDSASGVLAPSQSIKVTGSISSLLLSSEQGTQSFEVWADEVGTSGISNEAIGALSTKVNDLDALLSEKANQTEVTNNTTSIGKLKTSISSPYTYRLKHFNVFNNADNLTFLTRIGNVSPAWTVSSNNITAPIGQSDNTLFVVNNVTFVDGKIQVVCENPSTAAGWWGIVINHNSIGNKMLVVMVNKTNFQIWSADGTAFTKINGSDVALSDPDVAQTTGVPSTLEVEKIGSKVYCYVNNRLVKSLEVPFIQTLNNGSVGVISEGSFAFQFSNFGVYEKRFDTFNVNDINKVICLGSSITNGVNQTTKWRDKFATKINESITGKPVSVINGGVNGSSTTDMLNRLPALIIANPDADICVVEGSINDTKDTSGISADTTISNLRTMIRMCKQYNIIPMVTTSTPIVVGLVNAIAPDWTNNSWIRIHTVNNRIRQLAFEENIRLIDNAKGFGQMTYADKVACVNDGLHPNVDGAEIMAQTALNALINA